MRKFWLGLWLRWALWIAAFSVAMGAAASAVLTFVLYLLKGMPPLEGEVPGALWRIATFGFPILWSVALLTGMLLSVKRLFGRCIGGHELQLYRCDGEERIASPGVADTLKVWRKWLFALIWLVAFQVTLGAAIAYLSGARPMEWFSLHWLLLFVLLAGGATLPLMGSRCSMVKVARC